MFECEPFFSLLTLLRLKNSGSRSASSRLLVTTHLKSLMAKTSLVLVLVQALPTSWVLQEGSLDSHMEYL